MKNGLIQENGKKHLTSEKRGNYVCADASSWLSLKNKESGGRGSMSITSFPVTVKTRTRKTVFFFPNQVQENDLWWEGAPSLLYSFSLTLQINSVRCHQLKNYVVPRRPVNNLCYPFVLVDSERDKGPF